MNDLSDQRNDDGVTPDLGRAEEAPLDFEKHPQHGRPVKTETELAGVSKFVAELELKARLDANFRTAFTVKYPLYFHAEDGYSYESMLTDCWRHAQYMEDSRRAAHPEWYQ